MSTASNLYVSMLNALSTKQLLARLKRLHQCEESSASSDRDGQIHDSACAIEFKDSPAWFAEHNFLKAVLAQREHIPKGPELAELRQKRAREEKSLSRRKSNQKR